MADEELAKKEAERARKRQLEDDHELDSAGLEPRSKRRRSSSVDSVSSISTRSSRSPPPRRRASPSPPRARGASPPPIHSRRSRSRSFASVSVDSRKRSPSPETSYRARGGGKRSPIRRSPSVESGNRSCRFRRRDSPSPADESPPRKESREESLSRDSSPPRRRRYSRGSGDEERSRPHGRFNSTLSGRPDPRAARRLDEGGHGRYRDRSRSRDREVPARVQERQRAPPRQPEPPRQRSLSPFSKRLALTQAMNIGN